MKSGPEKRLLYQTEAGVEYIPTDELSSCEMLRFSVQISVMNRGHMNGSYVVMVYAKASTAVEGAPEKQLVGFSRVHTRAFGATEMSIEVDPCEHLSFANEHGKRILTLGEHILVVGDLKHFLLIAM
uniref:Fibronectin type III-like domain-containing protein n=1 Tax=Opuntia streptacantha TaxID=393608 RepID=A0A7C8YWM4_OPUST